VLDQTELEQRPVVINHLLPSCGSTPLTNRRVVRFSGQLYAELRQHGGFENAFGSTTTSTRGAFVSSSRATTSARQPVRQWDLGACRRVPGQH